MNQVSIREQTPTPPPIAFLPAEPPALAQAKPPRPESAPQQGKRIVRMLRHRFTWEYYAAGGWTADPKQAAMFIDAFEALQTCLRQRLTEVDLVLRVETGGGDLFSTPLR